MARAPAFGATGVPFFVVDGRYGVSGAQGTDVIARPLDQAWDERSPLTTVSIGRPRLRWRAT